MKRILIAGAQVPFVKGGAELLNESLLGAIKEHIEHVEVDIVQIPYTWYPENKLLENLVSWRMIDIAEVSGKEVDLVIPTKFPSYAINHPNKSLWLVHQYRQMYDLRDTKYDNSPKNSESDKIRGKLFSLDCKFLSECKAIHTISQNVSERLFKFNAFSSVPLMPPSNLKDDIRSGDYGSSIVCIGRIDILKRPMLLLEALKFTKAAHVKFFGTGDQKLIEQMKKFIRDNSLEKKVELMGFVEKELLIKSLAECRAVFYAPVDEDFGFATIEAMLARKLVITCSDSGEVTSIVNKTKSGWVCEPSAFSIAEVIDELYETSSNDLYDKSLGGFEFSSSITWTNVINSLVKPYL